MAETGAHILIFPYPAQGHMMPLLDLTHQLATRGLTITILVTPLNLPFLNPLLSKHPSITPLVLPFPTHPSIPAGIENVRDLPADAFVAMMQTLSELHKPILHWFQNHPSPPVAIISDLFLGWTHHLAIQLGIRRLVFSPSGVLALSIIFSLWSDLPKRNDPTNENEVISFPKIPSSPSYPWWQISPVYRSYVEGGPVSEFIKDGFVSNITSWGLVINTFTELERVYLDYLKQMLGHDRVWTVGPLHQPPNQVGPSERGGSSSVLSGEILSWLDQNCIDETVVYVCFGSQAVLKNEQMEELALGLEKSKVKFIWSVKEATKGHEKGEQYGRVPPGFEDRVAGRGLVIRAWVPQVLILSHKSVGAFLTHCGWNSVLEGLVAGVSMLAWPMGADQFANATLLVDELKVAVRVCEGDDSVPNSDELAELIGRAVGEKRVEMVGALELSKCALNAIKENGSSFEDLNGLVGHLNGPHGGEM